MLNFGKTMMRKIQCIFCESDKVELFSLFGQTLLGSQYYCQNCKSIFEVVRFEEERGDGQEEDDGVAQEGLRSRFA